MFAKVKVTGYGIHPLFKFLIQRTGKITSNFTKFLINYNGDIIERYEASDDPEICMNKI